MDPVTRLETIRLLNLERQRKFYAANHERVNSNKRDLYAQMRALYTSNSPPPAAALMPLQPVAVREPSPAAALIPDTHESLPPGFDVWTDFRAGFELKGYTNKYYSAMQTAAKIMADDGTDLKRLLALKGKGKIGLKLKKLLDNAVNVGKPYATNSKKAYAQAFLVYITEFQTELRVKDETRESIYELVKSYNMSSTIDNEQKQADVEANQYPDIDDWTNKVAEVYGDGSVENVIAMLYNEITARDDFHLHVISNVKDARSRGDRNNYIVIPRRGPCTVRLNAFKTNAGANDEVGVGGNGVLGGACRPPGYKPFEEKLTADLSDLIRLYQSEKPSTNGTLFETSDKTGLSNRVGRINARILPLLGATCTSNCAINYIRKMKVAALFASDGVNDPAKRADLARKMMHSTVMQVGYNRPSMKK